MKPFMLLLGLTLIGCAPIITAECGKDSNKLSINRGWMTEQSMVDATLRCSKDGAASVKTGAIGMTTDEGAIRGISQGITEGILKAQGQ